MSESITTHEVNEARQFKRRWSDFWLQMLAVIVGFALTGVLGWGVSYLATIATKLDSIERKQDVSTMKQEGAFERIDKVERTVDELRLWKVKVEAQEESATPAKKKRLP